MSLRAKPNALRDDIAALLQSGEPLDDPTFNTYALRVFAYQYEHNTPYRRYCERRGVDPDGVTGWTEIPAVPTAAFKEAALVSGDPAAAQAVFRTSGTTQGKEKRGQHFVLDLELYDLSCLPTFRRFVMPDAGRMPIVSLVPPWKPGGESSLAYMITRVIDTLGTEDSWFAVDENGLHYEQLMQWLHEQVERARAVCVVGTSLAFVHWFDALRTQSAALVLPAGSRIMDTGGFKGLQRAVTSAELRAAYYELLGVPDALVINEYGMTEMLSQYYDTELRGEDGAPVKAGPPWLRYAVVDPLTLRPLPEGQTGLLRHFDLANLFSVSAIQTEDIGRIVPGGFQLLGRAAGAAPRGCSIAMDMFLSSVRK